MFSCVEPKYKAPPLIAEFPVNVEFSSFNLALVYIAPPLP